MENDAQNEYRLGFEMAKKWVYRDGFFWDWDGDGLVEKSFFEMEIEMGRRVEHRFGNYSSFVTKSWEEKGVRELTGEKKQ